MKVTLFMAMSVNGMIADREGNEDFLSHANWDSFVTKAKECGNFIVGRKTYDAVSQWDESYGFDSLTDLDRMIISSQTVVTENEDYFIAHSPEEAITQLSDKGHQHLLVIGGAAVSSAFLKEDLLDEIIVNVEPVAVGQGIPLFAPEDFETELDLVDTQRLEAGIVQLRYTTRNK